MIMRRRQLPAHLEGPYRAFLAVLEELEPAKAGLADVLPTTRLPGRPLHDAVGEYRRRLAAAQPLMPSWRTAELTDEWEACGRGLREAARRAERVLAAATEPVGFEELLGTVERLMDPLEPFAVAGERFRMLRRRRARSG